MKLLWATGTIALGLGALLANAWLVSRETRAAVARDGGTLEATAVVPANVLVEGRGPAILLIHGFGAALDWWDAIAPDLARDHRVIRLDLIGHGGTAAPRSGYAIARQADLVSAVLDANNVDRVIVIGHSMGGEVATALAEAQPSRIEKLVLIDAPPAAGGSFNAPTRLFMTPIVGPLLSRVVTRGARRQALAQGFAPGFPVPERFVDDLAQLPYPAVLAAHRASFSYRAARNLPDRLALLARVPPLLVIFGALDQIVPAVNADRYEQVPGARLAILDGVGHSPFVEAPKPTLKLIHEFLRSTHPADPHRAS
ncbi:MAG: alpha/beta fold hydrolase [Hyphomicrobiales bacterium]|nr:alpha/beta fold hydrolase [Hyphomicrobiales bacterium]